MEFRNWILIYRPPALVKFNNIDVLATAVTGAIGGAKLDVYTAVPLTIRAFETFKRKSRQYLKNQQDVRHKQLKQIREEA